MEFVRLIGRIWDQMILTMILVKATNTSTKTRYPFATVKSEDVKVSETRLPAKTLATRTSCGLISVRYLCLDSDRAHVRQSPYK